MTKEEKDNKGYNFDCYCRNCGFSFESSRPFGTSRPAKVGCPECGNLAITRVIDKPDYRRG